MSNEVEVADNTSLLASLGEDGDKLQGVIRISVERILEGRKMGFMLSRTVDCIVNVAKGTCIERKQHHGRGVVLMIRTMANLSIVFGSLTSLSKSSLVLYKTRIAIFLILDES